MNIPIPKSMVDRLVQRAMSSPYPKHHLVDEDGSVYMERYVLVPFRMRTNEQRDARTKLAINLDKIRDIAARVHVTHRSDRDRYLHDHPWWNISYILEGSYAEVMPQSPKQHPELDDVRFTIELRKPGDIVFRRATDRHRLILPHDEHGNPAPCKSLFITGPYQRSWGFHTPQGWVHYKVWLAKRAEEYAKYGRLEQAY